jgi:hypothetical protein
MAADPTQLKFVNEAERQYFAEAVIGEEVRQFLVSTVGRFLHGCAKAEYDRCRDRTFDIDVYTQEGKKEYMNLKADAWAAAHFMQWCAEAIHTGDTAAVMLEQSGDPQ